MKFKAIAVMATATALSLGMAGTTLASPLSTTRRVRVAASPVAAA